MNGQQQPPDAPGAAEGPPVDLAQVQRYAVELLAQLGRPPRSLRIRAGTVAVDITWADRAGPADADASSVAPAWTAPPAAVAVAATAAVGVTPGTGGAAHGYLRSPGVGIFYHSSEPGAEPFVSVDTDVQPGQQIGIIEAMKLMVPVEADRGGRITEVLKANGEPVEFDEPLFALETADC